MKRTAFWIPVVCADKKQLRVEKGYEEWWAPQVRCSNCGNVTLDRGRFCSECGLPMDGLAPTVCIDGKPYYYAWNEKEQVGVFWPCEEEAETTAIERKDNNK